MADIDAVWVGMADAARIGGVSHATIRTWSTFHGIAGRIRTRITAIGTLYNRADLVRKAEERKGQ